MMRIKLFGLFIAFALLALVRPRKCLELLEAADRGVEAKQRREMRRTIHARVLAEGAEGPDVVGPIGECPLPPPGWRCTRAAGHGGPCAAVAK